MKAIKADLPEHLESAEILPLADLHIGDQASDWKLVTELIDYIKNKENCYCTLNGDLMDTAIASSIGDTYGATHNPMEQLSLCVKLFEPIKHKILAVCPGNHENRTYKTDGIDMTQIMCNQLGIPGRYTPTTALIFVRLGHDRKHSSSAKPQQVFYSIYQTHGTGGGRREGGKINRLADLATIVDADIYICSHTHLPAIFKTGYYRTNAHASMVNYVDKLFVNTASALDYNGYGDTQGYKPTSKDFPKIILDGSRKKATAIL